MQKLLLFVLACFVAASFAQSDVIDLTADAFDSELAKHTIALVEFYAPWCGHCKKLVPEYEAAATELKADNIVLAKIDASAEENSAVAQKFGIRGFPTLKIFRSGSVASDYNGGRTASEIVTYMRKQNLPAVSKIATTEELTAFTQKFKVAIVGFFESETSDAYTAFAKVAEKLRESHTFGAVFSTEVAATAEAAVGSVVLYKQFDDLKNTLEAENLANLESFVVQNSLPWVDEIGANNYATYSGAGKPVAFLFLNVETDKEQFPWVQEQAKATRGKLSWVYIDFAKYGRYGERIGLTGTKNPSFAIEDFGTGLHFALDESKEVSQENVKEIVDAFLAGTLEPTIRSEEIPVPNDQPVKVIVAKSFDSMVIQNDKDVLVEFYAPWCGHCKSLAPIYDEVASTLSGVDTLTIAKLDATANDVDKKYNVQGFPTIKFFKAGQKNQPMDYNGARTKEGFLAFLKENAAHAFDLPKDEL